MLSCVGVCVYVRDMCVFLLFEKEEIMWKIIAFDALILERNEIDGTWDGEWAIYLRDFLYRLFCRSRVKSRNRDRKT